MIVLTACGAAMAEPAKTIVLPLAELTNKEGSPTWVSRAVGQSLADELARVPGVEVATAAATQPAVDLDAAIKQARESQARFAIFGNFQQVAGQIRVSGQVVDATVGKSIGGFKATADERELFALEDLIADQVKRVLRDALPLVAIVPPGQQNPPLVIKPLRPIFEGSDLQRALEDSRPLRPERIVPDVRQRYYDDFDYISYPIYYSPLYTSCYPFYRSSFRYGYGYRSPIFYGCGFQPRVFTPHVTITSHAQDYTRGQGLIAAYPTLTANFVPRNEGIRAAAPITSSSSAGGRLTAAPSSR
jgi:TolB-like protein